MQQLPSATPVACAAIAVAAVAVAVAASAVAAAGLPPPAFADHTYNSYHFLTRDIPIDTSTLYIVHMETHYVDNRTGLGFASYPVSTASDGPNITLVNRGGHPALIHFYLRDNHTHTGPVAVPAWGTVNHTLPAQGTYGWWDSELHDIVGEHTYRPSTANASLVPVPYQPPPPYRPPVPDKYLSIAEMYARIADVRIPTSLVTLVTAGNLTAGVPPHALAVSEYVAFAAPRGGPSYSVELSQGNSSIANFSLAPGTNHGLKLPAEGFYQWTANGTAARGEMSWFG